MHSLVILNDKDTNEVSNLRQFSSLAIEETALQVTALHMCYYSIVRLISGL